MDRYFSKLEMQKRTMQQQWATKFKSLCTIPTGTTKNEVFMYSNQTKNEETGLDERKTEKEVQVAFINMLYKQGYLEDDIHSMILDKVVKGDVLK